jgi:Zn-dependent protease with chaperone function
MSDTTYSQKCEKEFRKNIVLALLFFLLPLSLFATKADYYLYAILNSKIVLHLCHFLQTIIPSILNIILIIIALAFVLSIPAGILRSIYHFFQGITFPSFMKPYLTEKFIEKEMNLSNMETFRLIEVENQTPFAFAGGIINKRIIVSSAMKNALSPEEFESVLLHEAGHLKMNHPLKRVLINSIFHALYLIPFRRELMQKFKLLVELAADEFAVSLGARPAVLASAIVKVAKNNRFLETSAMAGFTNSQAKQRVHALLGVEEEKNLNGQENMNTPRRVLKCLPAVLLTLFLIQPFFHRIDSSYCVATAEGVKPKPHISTMLSVCTELDCNKCDICNPQHSGNHKTSS